MSRTGLKILVLGLMMAVSAGLWQQNQLMAHWPQHSEHPAPRPQRPAPPALRALALAKGLPVISQPGRPGYLQSSAPLTAAQFNLWLQRLAREHLSPESMTLRPAEGEGLLTISDTGFKHD